MYQTQSKIAITPKKMWNMKCCSSKKTLKLKLVTIKSIKIF